MKSIEHSWKNRPIYQWNKIENSEIDTKTVKCDKGIKAT
jgi:hypothetical protein